MGGGGERLPVRDAAGPGRRGGPVGRAGAVAGDVPALRRLPGRWAAEVEPGLDPAWLGHAGLANTRVVVSAEELAAIEDGIERLLAPYVTRDVAERPAGARGVRLLRYVLPEGAEEQTGRTP